MHEVLVNRLGGLSLPRNSVVRLTDRPDMTLDVYRGRKPCVCVCFFPVCFLEWDVEFACIVLIPDHCLSIYFKYFYLGYLYYHLPAKELLTYSLCCYLKSGIEGGIWNL